jgi:hypothetical protein
VKYAFANTTAQRENKLNFRGNTPAAVKMNESNLKPGIIFGVIKQIYHIGRGICEKYQS